MVQVANKQDLLIEKINGAGDREIVDAVLATSEKVLKRITDGIYRQPSSALRELISNAYDADATVVEIQTDPPRFESIIVRDDGNGLTEGALASLIYNIGGSPKRTSDGAKLGICHINDPTRSPGGRKLIGKIGIGLFAVSQLTKEFQIITKTKGSSYRLVADVVLGTHEEESLHEVDEPFETGSVKIWKVTATDTSAHGTDIILRNLLKRTKDDLISKDIWALCRPLEDIIEESDRVPRKPPSYHIGYISDDSDDVLESEPCLPWESDDPTNKRFERFYDAMINEIEKTSHTPSLKESLDNYLQMIWNLSLEAPVDYIAVHPFDLTMQPGIKMYLLGNEIRDSAKAITPPKGKTIRDEIKLKAPDRGTKSDFNIIIDGVQLFRPLRFTDLIKTQHAIKDTLIFYGKAKPNLEDVPIEVRGGNLEFEAYFLWNPKIIPKEHIGVMIRINDSSGTLFDETFLKYQVSEQTRLKQITAEIFVNRGLDAALNIDRESFNYAHPHYQYLTKWVHNALRQLATRHKTVAKKIREQAQKDEAKKIKSTFEQYLIDRLKQLRPDDFEEIPDYMLSDDFDLFSNSGKDISRVVFDRKIIFENRPKPKRRSAQSTAEESHFEAQVLAAAKILESFDLFERLPYEKQQLLLREIVNIFSFAK